MNTRDIFCYKTSPVCEGDAFASLDVALDSNPPVVKETVYLDLLYSLCVMTPRDIEAVLDLDGSIEENGFLQYILHDHNWDLLDRPVLTLEMNRLIEFHTG